MSLIGDDAPASAPGGVVKDGTDASFQADVLEASLTKPVIVDFWAPWCGPCKTLGPLLEAAVTAAAGKVTLVKINIDENPAVASQMRVQSIPAVVAFDKGQPVDGFMGAVRASEIDAFINRVAGASPDEDAVEQALARAAQALDGGDAGGAAQDFALVLQSDAENATAIAGLARCYLIGGDVERAKELLAAVPDDKADAPGVGAARSALALAEGAQGAGDLGALTAHLAGAPDDHEKRMELAKALAGRGDLDAAAGHLLQIVESDRDWSDGAARAELLTIFEAAGAKAQVTIDGRRKLSSILFS